MFLARPTFLHANCQRHENVLRFIYLVSHAIRVIFIRNGENKGAQISKGFDWTQHSAHYLSPTKWNTPVYQHFEVRPVIRKQIFPKDTVPGHIKVEVPFTNHAGSYLRRRFGTLPSTFRSSNWNTWVWHSRNFVYMFLICMFLIRHLITQQQVLHYTLCIHKYTTLWFTFACNSLQRRSPVNFFTRK